MRKDVIYSKDLIKKMNTDAIKTGNFNDYQTGIMHEWLTTLSMLGVFLIPLFFVLDIFMMPESLLPRFAIYRTLSTFIALTQFFIIRRSKPSNWSYVHGYLFTLQIGGIISLMTTDLGGFNSSYYAGLNLIIIASNLLMPWRALHSALNALLTLALYVGLNLFAGFPFDTSILINNLFFLSATSIIAASISYVRFGLMKKEFILLVELEKARHLLFGEKELVEDRNKAIKSLLDVSEQGFLSFDGDFLVSSEYSRECDRIFGKQINGTDIAELLYPVYEERDQFKKGLNLYFSGKFKSDVVFDLLDDRFTIGNLIIKAEFKEVHASRVMIALTDITEDLRMQEEFRLENERKAMLLKVIGNRIAYSSFNKEASDLFIELTHRENGNEVLLRNVHTLKANAGFLGFLKTNKAAHELENFLADSFALDQNMDALEPIARLTSAYAEEHTQILDALGSKWQSDADSIEIPRSIYLKIEESLQNGPSDHLLIETLQGYRKKTISELFGRFPHMVEDLSLRMGKRIAPVIITGGSIPVFPEEYENLFESFSHLIRNIVDHGIELPGEREAKGKSAEGTVIIDTSETSSDIVFSFSDDGQGIRLDEIAKKAKAAGLIDNIETATSPQLLGLIFNDNFSTAATVSDISGRGLGLAAVRSAVTRMHGHIKVKTKQDAGTLFTINIPRIETQHKEAL